MLDGLIGQYKKLKTRERLLVIFFAVVIGAFLYHRLLYKPFAKNEATYRFQIEKLKSRLEELRAQFPELEEQKGSIDKVVSENETVSRRIIDIDRTIPARADASRLISEITRQSTEFELSSLQQKMDEGDTYSRIYVELEFNASYDKAVGFIKKVEGVSPFLKVEEMNITEAKAKSRGSGLSVSLLLSCLLREDSEVEWASAGKEAAGDVETAEIRNIFASGAKPAIVDKSKKKSRAALELDGITYTAWNPTAIINNDVVKVGMFVGEFEVKAIGPDTVTLTDGTEEILLTIQR